MTNLESIYTIFELPYDSTQEQFQNQVEHFKSHGYVIVGMISDIDANTNILIGRKPLTERERDERADAEARRVNCPDCKHSMEPGYQSNEWQCPECGLLWDTNTNKPLAFDPTDTGQYAFYSQEGRDVEY